MLPALCPELISNTDLRDERPGAWTSSIVRTLGCSYPCFPPSPFPRGDPQPIAAPTPTSRPGFFSQGFLHESVKQGRGRRGLRGVPRHGTRPGGQGRRRRSRLGGNPEPCALAPARGPAGRQRNRSRLRPRLRYLWARGQSYQCDIRLSARAPLGSSSRGWGGTGGTRGEGAGRSRGAGAGRESQGGCMGWLQGVRMRRSY